MPASQPNEDLQKHLTRLQDDIQAIRIDRNYIKAELVDEINKRIASHHSSSAQPAPPAHQAPSTATSAPPGLSVPAADNLIVQATSVATQQALDALM
jgi:hypothetical protein